MPKLKLTYLITTSFLITFTFTNLSGQQNNLVERNKSERQSTVEKSIFKSIERGISEGEVAPFSRFLSSQTYLSLSGGTSGYYSANQAFYVLEEFFKLYRVTSFKFEVVKTGIESPYATGVYSYEIKGKRKTSQVYVSLKRTGREWNITQLTIN